MSINIYIYTNITHSTKADRSPGQTFPTRLKPRHDPTRLRGAAVAARRQRTLDPMEVPWKARLKQEAMEDTMDHKKAPWIHRTTGNNQRFFSFFFVFWCLSRCFFVGII